MKANDRKRFIIAALFLLGQFWHSLAHADAALMCSTKQIVSDWSFDPVKIAAVQDLSNKIDEIKKSMKPKETQYKALFVEWYEVTKSINKINEFMNRYKIDGVVDRGDFTNCGPLWFAYPYNTCMNRPPFTGAKDPFACMYFKAFVKFDCVEPKTPMLNDLQIRKNAIIATAKRLLESAKPDLEQIKELKSRIEVVKQSIFEARLAIAQTAAMAFGTKDLQKYYNNAFNYCIKPGEASTKIVRECSGSYLARTRKLIHSKFLEPFTISDNVIGATRDVVSLCKANEADIVNDWQKRSLSVEFTQNVLGALQAAERIVKFVRLYNTTVATAEAGTGVGVPVAVFQVAAAASLDAVLSQVVENYAVKAKAFEDFNTTIKELSSNISESKVSGSISVRVAECEEEKPCDYPAEGNISEPPQQPPGYNDGGSGDTGDGGSGDTGDGGSGDYGDGSDNQCDPERPSSSTNCQNSNSDED